MVETKALLVATRNPHKTTEIAALLGPAYRVSDLSSLPQAPEVEETGATFLENATLKALAISRLVEELVVADDSGLEVDALGGRPGVRSARFAGPVADDAANNARLLAELRDVPADRRTARFRCVIVAARGGAALAHFAGAVEGRVVDEPRGTAGFGYDPLFIPDGFQESFAELGAEVKNRLSHRAAAIAKLVAWLRPSRDGPS